MLGPEADIASATPTAPNATPSRESRTDATIANTTIPSSPSCSARRRPVRASATWPQIGIEIIRTTAIAARIAPISPASNPRPDR
jgi:hypothetical protein